MKVVRTKGGAQLLHGGSIVSTLPASPGPTNSVFDLFAAATRALGRGDRVAMLGFAAGGTVAPLRALGFGGTIRAVDLDLSGEAVFREVANGWAGDVQVDKDDASAWLMRQRPFDVILEDLSENLAEDVSKPAVSFTKLPQAISARLKPDGIAVLNALPVAGWTWKEIVYGIAHPWRTAQQILFRDYVNRFVIVGAKLPAPRIVSSLLRKQLSGIGSSMAGGFKVQTIEPGR